MNQYHTIAPEDISRQQLHHFILSAVAPRPICFASTIDKDGNVNLSPFSYFNVFSTNPPILVFSPTRRGRDNSTKNTHENVLEVKQTVINIVNYPMVEQMSLSSTEYAKGVNEFIKAGFTEVASTKVQPPRVGEAPVAFECEIEDIIALGEGPGAGNLVISRVVLLHIQKRYLDDEGKLDTQALDLVARMGGNWYSRAIPESLFEIPKPLRTRGIGIDRLPQSIRESHVLTANNLGRLGNVEQLPSKEEIQLLLKDPEIKMIIQANSSQPDTLVAKLHLLGKDLLERMETKEALKVLMLGDFIQ